MHYAPPTLLAATLAAALVPAQAEAPTGPSAQLQGRFASGKLVDARRKDDVLVAAAPAVDQRDAVSDAAPLPPERAERSAAVHVAQADSPRAAATPPAPPSQPAPAAAPAHAPATTARRTRAGATAPADGNRGGLVRPCSDVTVDQPTTLMLGKSRVIRLPFPAARVIVGGLGGSRASSAEPAAEPEPQQRGRPGAAQPNARQRGGSGLDGVAETDVTLLSPTELFFLGRRTGSMNVVLQANDGRCLVKDIVVTIDPGTLQAKLAELMPEESGVKVRGADNAIVLTGDVTDAVKLDHVLSLASSYGDGKKVVNLLRVNSPQQVMLEVKIAEVSKTLLDRFGLDFTRLVTSANGARSSVISGIIGGVPGVLGSFNPNSAAAITGAAVGAASSDIAAASGALTTAGRGATTIGLDMKKQDGIFRVLAEPNIVAISGQAASFLSGGKILIPVSQASSVGGSTITLEEKEFGVGLKFTPTVLDGGRVNLKVLSEVSELSQTGTPFTTVGGVTAVLPSLTTRRVDTTVQLGDGQSFVVAGLIRNNVTEALNKFPGLGEAPVVGALFRSTEFQNDQTELMFVVTPHLVKPIAGTVPLPTDNHIVPSRADVILRGSGEGSAPAPGNPAPPPVPQPALPGSNAPAPTAPSRP